MFCFNDSIVSRTAIAYMRHPSVFAVHADAARSALSTLLIHPIYQLVLSYGLPPESPPQMKPIRRFRDHRIENECDIFSHAIAVSDDGKEIIYGARGDYSICSAADGHRLRLCSQ